LLWYVNTSLNIFEPRGHRHWLPFNSYRYQDSALTIIRDAIGSHDLVIKKSRDVGASWMCLAVLEWMWHFHGMNTFLLLSRKEELVDKTGDMSELFAKIDFMHRWQPAWMLPVTRRRHLKCDNLDNASELKGESSNTFAGVADRKLAILLDEFSKMENQQTIFSGTRDVTDSRIFNFTPNGSANIAADIASKPDQFKQLEIHWSLHPVKAQGLYKITDAGQAEPVDKGYWTPERVESYTFQLRKPRNPRYPFRSPWYDRQCVRANHEMEIAQELDIDFLASDAQFFEPEVLDRLSGYTRPPLLVGELEYDRSSGDPIQFTQNPAGNLRLWFHLTPQGHPVPGDYGIGADISTGTGATNTVFVGADKGTGQQVLEYANPRIRPEEAAVYCVALCKWLRNAFLVWESEGPGRNFCDRLLETRYRNFYWRTNEIDIGSRPTLIPGWFPTKQNRVSVFGTYRRAMISGEYVIRSHEQLNECKLIVFTSDQSIEHSSRRRTDDPSGARENHADRPTAGALALKAIGDRNRYDPQSDEDKLAANPPLGSLAHRMQKYQQALSLETVWG
jgi:hypothetical protein